MGLKYQYEKSSKVGVIDVLVFEEWVTDSFELQEPYLQVSTSVSVTAASPPTASVKFQVSDLFCWPLVSRL
jgi:hypothetical protein